MVSSFKCRDCGKTLEGTNPRKHFCPSCREGHKQQYNELYMRAHRDKYSPKIACPQCGQPMCVESKLCETCYFKERRGEKHPSWKGGRYEARGYIFILKPDYPRSNCQGYILEHIFIWETLHNKPLPKGWEVHHLNGVRNDNRSSNLFAVSKKQHTLIIPKLQKRIQELEASLNNQHQLL